MVQQGMLCRWALVEYQCCRKSQTAFLTAVQSDLPLDVDVLDKIPHIQTHSSLSFTHAVCLMSESFQLTALWSFAQVNGFYK